MQVLEYINHDYLVLLNESTKSYLILTKDKFPLLKLCRGESQEDL